MPKLSSLLLKIPDEFKPLAAMSIGALILVALVLFHGVSLHRILVQHKRAALRLQGTRPHVWGAEFLFGWSVFLMLGLHIFEIASWAFVLNHLGLIVKPADALYFCANAYTTVGYGAVDLGPNWRNISPIISISGLFTFAWTTSSLVGMVTSHLRLLEQLEVERQKEHGMRQAMQEAAWDVYAEEETAELSARADARKRAATASFFERRKVWHEEKRTEEGLRVQAQKDADELRRRERLQEEQLGAEINPDDPSQLKDKK